MTTKKIAIACNSLAYSGGMEHYTLLIIQELKALGYSPIVFTKKFDPKVKEELQVEVHSFNVRYIPKILEEDLFSWWVRSKLREQEFITSIACCRTNACEVIICGGNHKGYIRRISKNSFKDRHFCAFEQKAFEKAKLLVAHSKFMHDELIELYNIPKEKIVTIYPPVDVRKFSTISLKEKQLLKSKLGMASDRIAFLFPSTGHKRKGLELIAKAFEGTELPVHLYIAGSNPRKEYKNISYIGYRKDIESYYRAADVTILASSYEPFGLVGIESVLCGTPVAFPNGTGCTEVLVKDVAWFPFELSVESISLLLDNIVKRPPLPIAHPLSCVTYDPTPRKHIEDLLQVIRTKTI